MTTETPTTKPARKSRTIITFGSALTASVVALALHYLELVALPAEAVAALVTSLVTSVVGLVLRLKTSSGIDRKTGGVPPTTTMLLALLACWMALPTGGCGSTFRCAKAYERQLKPTAPFTDNAVCDGDEVFRASGPIPASFRVTCPDGQTPAFDRDGVVTCRRSAP